jgi:DNA-binding protein Fis
MSYERIRGAHKSQAYAAEVLGIDRVTLHLKLKRFGWTRTPMESR